MTTLPIIGTYTALITPMREGKVLYEEFKQLIESQIESGVSGIMPVGTTGESPTVTFEEHIKLIEVAVEVAAGRVPVFGGTGANSTEEALHLTKEADKAGVTGMLVVAPYYNKPSQEGLFRHFSAIAEVTEKPIILYSIPSRCGIEIGVETVARLAERFPHVNTIKEAGGSCEKVAQLIERLGDKITVVSGDDSLTLPFMALGAKGVISVASNLMPAGVVQMVQAALDNDFNTATALSQKYYRLFKDLFIEPNPVPVKYALHRAGVISSPEVRLPLCSLSEDSEAVLINTLKTLGY